MKTPWYFKKRVIGIFMTLVGIAVYLTKGDFELIVAGVTLMTGGEVDRRRRKKEEQKGATHEG